jgi:hypothetical protein
MRTTSNHLPIWEITGHINSHALDHLSHLWRCFRSTERQSDEAHGVTDTIRAVTGSRGGLLPLVQS